MLTINPKSSKAYFRSASSLKVLERYEEAIDCCNRCLAYDAENDVIISLRSQLEILSTAQNERRRRREVEEQKKRMDCQKMNFALRVIYHRSGKSVSY